eukprot:COSAG03_NODE_6008_length_1131_cov_20.359496_1_plen_146_part_10
MDRNLTVFGDYAMHLPRLGAKRARLQCGWGRCDRTGQGAPYNWGWLDEAVFGLAAMGVRPWLELSYGNPHYAGGGANGPGAAVPNGSVALAAWGEWVAAVAERYANVTDEFEVCARAHGCHCVYVCVCVSLCLCVCVCLCVSLSHP